VRFFQIDGIMLSFAKIKYFYLGFAKFMELCENLPKIWSYAKICQKYGII
jgi:hypothetical protein